MTTTLEPPPASGLQSVSGPLSDGKTPPLLAWYSLTALWRRKTTVLAALSIAGILLHLVLRFGFHAAPEIHRLPLLATLIVGGLPQLYDLLVRLWKREFGSDLLGGISIVTSILLGEYLAGSIIVLMLSGGAALESYALRSASSATFGETSSSVRATCARMRT